MEILTSRLKTPYQKNFPSLESMIMRFSINHRLLSLAVIVGSVGAPGLAPAVLADVGQSGSATSTSKQDAGKSSNKSGVRGWFDKYDQIRRGAEMTWGEKMQCRSVLEKGLKHAAKVGDKHKALAEKMVKKYADALAAMQGLQSIPETKELQDGYVEFFRKGHKLWQDCLGGDGQEPAEASALEQSRSQLLAHDKKIKKLDEELRKKFSIPHHRHI
jgi:hypothetical protein